ncbi:MAG: glycoside hydrolase family 30 beta sandwich domain-containing protein, partial [Paludibacter sp.]
NELFDKSTGLGISVLRISIGASDLSSSDYSYNETANDVSMLNFSLAGPDMNYLIPLLKKILVINPAIKILATPWSAPRWMKTNGSWIGGSLKTNYYAAYANYFVKYLDAMKSQGITVWGITPQNEPENPNNEPSMTMTSTEEKNFIDNNLGPAITNAGYSSVKIIAFDHNCDNTAYPIDVCNNSSYVDGAAFHLYAGNISALTTVRNATNKNVYFTEQYTASNGSFSGDLGWHLQNVVLGSANNWAKTVIEWNLANNAGIGPHTPGGCTTCLGAITVNNSTSYTRNVSYYIIGQISKFVNPGAIRIGSTVFGSNVSCATFQNLDGTLASVIYNGNSAAQTVKLVWNSLSFTYSVPGSTAATFVWNGSPNAISEIKSETVNLLPNPGHTFVRLKQPENGTGYDEINFISLDGKIALKKSLLANNQNDMINISGLANGMYLLEMTGGAKSFFGKFIKE